ncbi:lytic transglycosylase catalytic [Serratia liquefaciens]|uniref:lytic transglycosylase catalytic n=1 Tax=Serratia liquefaciens TaxID=614 RepID=UPI0039062FDF
MSGETIKDFLVSLGFQIDDAGARKFEAAITGATMKVVKMGAAVEAAALSVVGFTAKIASGLDQIYQASQRTGATVEGIQSIGFAVSQLGGNADAARGSLESLARFVRNSPGAEGFLNRLGVQTRDASGKMHDMSSIFTGVGQKLNSMPYYRANQYAQMLGIDENTLLAMRQGIGQFGAKYTAMAKAIGYNATAAAASSHRFMLSLRDLGAMVGMARDKIGSNLANGLAGSLDTLRKRIQDNFPKIENVVTQVVKGILWLGEIVGRVAGRVVNAISDVTSWWKSLDDETKKLVGTIGLLTAAWRILSSTFWMSPIGIIATLILGMALLWEDYKTWKEHGDSLIDWSKWQPSIEKAKDAIVWLRDRLLELKDTVGGWQKSLELLATFVAGAWISKITGAFAKLAGIPMPPWLKGWMAYAAYLYDDRDNITASAKSSWDYTKGNIGDAMRAVGIDTDFGRNPHAVKDNSNVTADIPGYQQPVQHAQSAKRTLADRNNNPGNIRPVGAQGFRFFESALHGWEAMKNQLMRYFNGKTTGRQLQTIWDIVKTWAPASDSNDPQKYAQDVAKWMGVSPNAVLNLTNPNTMGALMQSMARKEGYSNWNSPLAYKAAVGGSPSIQQETHIIINGVSDPRAAGKEVADRQSGVNVRTVQALQGAG